MRRRPTIAALLAFAAGGATGAQSAATHTYYALVFSAPVPGREADYNRWYDQEHAPAVVSIPGFVSGQRYVRSDLQLRANAGESPAYLVIYKIVTADLAAIYREVAARAADGRTRMSSALARGSGMNLTYELTAKRNWRDGAASGSMPTYLHIVLANSRPGEEQALDRWYRRHHANDMSRLSGFSGYVLGRWSPVQMVPDAKG